MIEFRSFRAAMPSAHLTLLEQLDQRADFATDPFEFAPT
jgi:hypothetical protein